MQGMNNVKCSFVVTVHPSARVKNSAPSGKEFHEI